MGHMKCTYDLKVHGWSAETSESQVSILHERLEYDLFNTR